MNKIKEMRGPAAEEKDYQFSYSPSIHNAIVDSYLNFALKNMGNFEAVDSQQFITEACFYACNVKVYASDNNY